MEGLGAAIREIIQFYTIRGKFSSVHPDLAAEGITRVMVEDTGLQFVMDNGGPGWSEILLVCFFLHNVVHISAEGDKEMLVRGNATKDNEEAGNAQQHLPGDCLLRLSFLQFAM